MSFRSAPGATDGLKVLACFWRSVDSRYIYIYQLYMLISDACYLIQHRCALRYLLAVAIVHKVCYVAVETVASVSSGIL